MIEDTDMKEEFKIPGIKQQKKVIKLPNSQLDLGSIEINFLLSAHESIISQFKANKRFIEKELSQLLLSAKKMKKTGRDKSSVTLKGIDDLLQKIAETKETYLSMTALEDKYIQSLDARLNEIQKISNDNKSVGQFTQYMQNRLNRIILDWFLHKEKFETAKTFTNEANLQNFTNIEVFMETNNIYQELKKTTVSSNISDDQIDLSIECALSWCNTYKTKLQQNGSQLEFHLRILKFMQFIKLNQCVGATEYAKAHFKKYLCTDGDKDQTKRSQQTLVFQAMGLLGIPHNLRPKYDTYRYFTNDQRWIELQDQFLIEATSLFHIDRTPLIQNCIQVGLSSMKTVFCNHKSDAKPDIEMANEDSQRSLSAAFGLPSNQLGASLSGSIVPQAISVLSGITAPVAPARYTGSFRKNSSVDDSGYKELLNSKTRHLEGQCPACDPQMLKLSKQLKNAQQIQTNMKCKISGKVMDDQDPPFWIPLIKSELTEKQKEEQNKNSIQEIKMTKGYLICKSQYEAMDEVMKSVEDQSSAQKKDQQVKSIKCPFTGDLIEKQKIRKVYFC